MFRIGSGSPAVIEPVDPLERREFDGCKTPPESAPMNDRVVSAQSGTATASKWRRPAAVAVIMDDARSAPSSRVQPSELGLNRGRGADFEDEFFLHGAIKIAVTMSRKQKRARAANHICAIPGLQHLGLESARLKWPAWSAEDSPPSPVDNIVFLSIAKLSAPGSAPVTAVCRRELFR